MIKEYSMAVKNDTKIVTPEFRVSYCNIFTPTKNESGQDVYGLTMIYGPDTDITPLLNLAKAKKEEKWGKDFAGKVKTPFRKGTPDEFDLTKNPEYKGNIIVAARSYNHPVGLVNTRREPIIDRNEFYSGCYAIATITAFTYDNPKSGKGVSFSLQNVMMTRKGEPLAGVRAPAEEDFKAIDVSQYESAQDPLSKLDDDLGI